MSENEIGKLVVDECIHLHRALGPGLLEIVCEVTLARRLEKKGLKVVRQVSVPIECEGEQFDKEFRADLMIEEKIILELKSVEKISPVHQKQLLTYLKLTGLKLGFLLNFGDGLLKNGITRTINGNLEECLVPWCLGALVPWCLGERRSEPVVALNPAAAGRREWGHRWRDSKASPLRSVHAF
jgi:GxxExxY protein